jgi:histidinol-phosphate aminotransferase
MSWVASLARADILALEPYAHAVWQPGLTRLHANELPWRAAGDESAQGLNRYPEPQSPALIARLAEFYRIPLNHLLLCRGSDEAIDVLVRAFCRAGEDAVITCPPTFGMYEIAARLQGAQVVSVPLLADRGFALDVSTVLDHCAANVKLVFLCSPNNPTGNLLASEAILEIVNALVGRAIVVVDHAYIEFAAPDDAIYREPRPANLAILRTLSKAHGLAGARLGTVIAHPEVVALLRKIVTPYAVPQLVIEAALAVLTASHVQTLPGRIALVRSERTRMQEALRQLPGVRTVLPSEANFLLVRFQDPRTILARALQAQLLIRDARSYHGLSDALRISIGAPDENDRLLQALA